MRLLRGTAVIALLSFGLAYHSKAEEKNVTWTGWFSDLKCATARAGSGTFGATNPECARNCMKQGVAPAFIGEQATAVYQVKDYPGVVDDLGFHVEIQASVDDAAKTITVQHVKRLASEGAACGRPKRPSTGH
jgi:hypothetical protein